MVVPLMLAASNQARSRGFKGFAEERFELRIGLGLVGITISSSDAQWMRVCT